MSGRIAARSASTVGARDAARDEPRGDLVQDAGRASPSSPRRITPPSGSGVDSPTPPAASAAWLASSAWWSCAQSATRRPGAARSRSSAVGQRPRRSGSQPAPSIQASAGGLRAAAARTRATSTSIESASSSWTRARASAASARCRCESVRPGTAASSGPSSMTRVPGPRRGVDVADAPGRHDAPVGDADRLDPARAVVTGEGRDPAPDDEARVRHGRLRVSGGVDDRVVVVGLRRGRRSGRSTAVGRSTASARVAAGAGRLPGPPRRASPRPPVPHLEVRLQRRPRPGRGRPASSGPSTSPSSPPAAAGRAG